MKFFTKCCFLYIVPSLRMNVCMCRRVRICLNTNFSRIMIIQFSDRGCAPITVRRGYSKMVLVVILSVTVD